jgi:hypothetical protein
VQRQYFEHPEMFSSGIPASYFCDNSNSSFLKSENDTTMMRGPPEYYSIIEWKYEKYTIFKESHDKRGLTTHNAKLAELSLGAIVSI